MAGDTQITVVGNLTGAPELRFTPSGAGVANFTVAVTPRQFDKNSNEWKDQETQFWRCSIWREAAENVCESLDRGSRVIVTGRVISRSWEDKDSGQKRSNMEIQVDEIGPSLKYAIAKVTKAQRSDGNSRGQQASNAVAAAEGHQGGQRGFERGAQGPDPWATGSQQGQQSQQGGGQQRQPQGGGQQGGQGGGWGGPPSYDEPPF